MFKASTAISLNGKPKTSISEWIDHLTSAKYERESFDGVLEGLLAGSINQQSTGPAEASRALRKKLKHGDRHTQYRAVVVINELVVNCTSFRELFADERMVEVLKFVASDPFSDSVCKKKLVAVLSFWRCVYEDEPAISGLYRKCRPRKHEQSKMVDKYLADTGPNYESIFRC